MSTHHATTSTIPQTAAPDRFNKIESLTALVHEAIETSTVTFREWKGDDHPDTIRLKGLCWLLLDIQAEAQAGKRLPVNQPIPAIPPVEITDYAKLYRRERRKNMIMRESVRRIRRLLYAGLPRTVTIFGILQITDRFPKYSFYG